MKRTRHQHLHPSHLHPVSCPVQHFGVCRVGGTYAMGERETARCWGREGGTLTLLFVNRRRGGLPSLVSDLTERENERERLCSETRGRGVWTEPGGGMLRKRETQGHQGQEDTHVTPAHNEERQGTDPAGHQKPDATDHVNLAQPAQAPSAPVRSP